MAVTAESTVHGGVEADTHHHTVAEPEPSQGEVDVKVKH